MFSCSHDLRTHTHIPTHTRTRNGSSQGMFFVFSVSYKVLVITFWCGREFSGRERGRPRPERRHPRRRFRPKPRARPCRKAGSRPGWRHPRQRHPAASPRVTRETIPAWDVCFRPLVGSRMAVAMTPSKVGSSGNVVSGALRDTVACLFRPTL